MLVISACGSKETDKEADNSSGTNEKNTDSSKKRLHQLYGFIQIENELVKRTNAYKDGKVIYLNTEAWFYGGGLQSLKTMIADTEAYWN
ncbi:hypothetical protein SporoP37_09455 [Sporosarcina sp. P37]|uniref:hypothetical protein n=1 Tax=unclassified Sporosarcina TaxID=2647733 RepID=UPI000A17C5F9|nr:MULTISPECIES: hypothetical protein [unclassified Sporosarcina]ARK24869.1 hypothetical protein SporoP37_09455 [Sporosarcina sp. P37]PID20027.1 hypothetical protein CSV62_01990 [Sporosarcina sp. P35]